MLIAALYHFFNRTHIACAKVCLKPRVAANHLCKLRFGIFAAAAQRHQRRHLYRAAALRAEAGIVIAVHIYAAALVKQPNAYPAAKVLHDERAFFKRLMQYLLGAFSCHGAGVQCMAAAFAREFGYAAYVRNVRHFVHAHAVVYHCRYAKRPCYGLRHGAANV